MIRSPPTMTRRSCEREVNLARQARPFRGALAAEDRRRLQRQRHPPRQSEGREFVWHEHDDTDDFFLVLKGHLTIQLRDRNVELDEGELFVVPRGVEHCPRADEEASVLLIEPVGTANTGDTGGPLTAQPQRI